MIKGLAQLFLLLAFSICANAENILRGPYLQDVTTSSILVVWDTDESTTSRISVLIDGDWKEVVDTSKTAHHALRVSHLRPNKRYRYRVYNDAGEKAATGTLRSAPRATETFRIRAAIFGDSGSGTSDQQAVSDQIALFHPHLALHTGDIVYDNGAWDEYDSRFFDIYSDWLRDTVFYPAFGNHDARGDGYSRTFHPPARRSQSNSIYYYSFPYAMAHFTALNTNEDFSPGSAQYIWLEHDLQSAIDSGARWKIVFFHHPPFSRGHHGNNQEVQDALLPIFEKYGVDLVLSGHDHAYERTGKLNTSGTGGEVLYLVTGGGGQSLYNALNASPNIQIYKKEFHFVALTISNSRITAKAINEIGETIDTFALGK